MMRLKNKYVHPIKKSHWLNREEKMAAERDEFSIPLNALAFTKSGFPKLSGAVPLAQQHVIGSNQRHQETALILLDRPCPANA